jgi:hypothetical protein
MNYSKLKTKVVKLNPSNFRYSTFEDKCSTRIIQNLDSNYTNNITNNQQ